jgi:ParB-like chromosome segregation protein Spo0J
MKTHPLADLFPPMTTEEMALLVEDIKANGLAQPIVTHGGEILDGRHRCTAANYFVEEFAV